MRQRDALATYNERIKLLAGFLNALAVGFVGFSLLRPLVDGTMSLEPASAAWPVVGLVLHGLAHYVIRYLETERSHDA